jgi:hypothetical protein
VKPVQLGSSRTARQGDRGHADLCRRPSFRTINPARISSFPQPASCASMDLQPADCSANLRPRQTRRLRTRRAVPGCATAFGNRCQPSYLDSLVRRQDPPAIVCTRALPDQTGIHRPRCPFRNLSFHEMCAGLVETLTVAMLAPGQQYSCRLVCPGLNQLAAARDGTPHCVGAPAGE